MTKTNLFLIAFTTLCVASAAFATTAFATKTTGYAETNSESGTEKNAEQLAIVMAIEADKDYGAYLGGECSTCHTPSGGDGSIPLIHAKGKDYIASALLEYKNQQRANEVMRGVANALSNEEIAALAAYFSEQ